MIRQLTPVDMYKAKCIWSECFAEDTPDFIEWYFSEIFDVGYGYFVDDELVSMVCITKRVMRVRGVDMPCAVIQGVGTLAEHRKKGYCEKVLEYALNSIKVEFPIAMLTTFIPKFYAKLGFATYLRTGLRKISERTDADAAYMGRLTPYRAAEYAELYEKEMQGKNGWLLRTPEDFLAKQKDQTSFAGEMLVKMTRNDELIGYAFVSEHNGKLYASEAIGECAKICESETRECAMIDAVENGELHSMIRILDFERAFEAVEIPPRELCLKVQDEIVKDNAKCWHIYSTGRRTKIVETAADPEEELTVGDVSALLLGATEQFNGKFDMYYMPRMQLESY